MDNLFVFLFIYLVKSNDWIEWSTIRDKAYSMPQKIRVRSSASNTIATKYHVIRMHNAVWKANNAAKLKKKGTFYAVGQLNIMYKFFFYD